MVIRMTFTAGLRAAGGEAASARVKAKKTTPRTNGTAAIREAPGAGREVNDLASDRDSVLIIDLDDTTQYFRARGAAAVPYAFLRQPLRRDAWPTKPWPARHTYPGPAEQGLPHAATEQAIHRPVPDKHNARLRHDCLHDVQHV